MQKLGKCCWQTRTRGEMGFSILFHFSFSKMLQPTRIWRHSRGEAEREKEKALSIIRCHIISFDMLFSLGPRLPALIHKYITTTLTQRALKEREKKSIPFFILFPFLNSHNCMPGKQWARQNVRAICSGQEPLKC